MAENTNLPSTTPAETGLNIAAAVASIVPWLGGPVQAVLGGMSLGRKMERIQEVLMALSDELKGFQSDVSESYVRSDDFQELLEATLRRVSEERNAEKRSVYKAFLSGAIQSPGEPYNEQLRFLRVLEDLRPDHLRVLKAISQTPGPPTGTITGSPVNTLRRRLGDMAADRIGELVADLNDHRLTEFNSLKTMMTATGAEDLRGVITNHGHRFLQYVVDA